MRHLLCGLFLVLPAPQRSVLLRAPALHPPHPSQAKNDFQWMLADALLKVLLDLPIDLQVLKVSRRGWNSSGQSILASLLSIPLFYSFLSPTLVAGLGFP